MFKKMDNYPVSLILDIRVSIRESLFIELELKSNTRQTRTHEYYSQTTFISIKNDR